ncbi:MAG: iron-sulfur cluster assembly scaffold protein [Chthoniobacterales bacterium]|nr:iron-sulfur cluster assembly scaffold protein [Chthoniobacterales bacterium]
MSDDSLTVKIENAAASPQNMGEMTAADAIGTVGSTNCGDMLRLWIKFKDEEDGRRIIDRATFQSFGCQTAIAVASVATELIRGKTAEEALSLSGEELSAPLGALPPMKIHCAQLVEQALQSALAPTTLPPSNDKPSCSSRASTLSDQLHPQTGKFKINILPS